MVMRKNIVYKVILTLFGLIAVVFLSGFKTPAWETVLTAPAVC